MKSVIVKCGKYYPPKSKLVYLQIICPFLVGVGFTEI